MSPREPAGRFLAAARRVAHALGLDDHLHALLTRFGLPGVATLAAPAEPDERDAAEAAYHRLYDTLLLEHAAAVSNALAGAGVPHFFFKGAALLASVYPPGVRVVSDLDLHVARSRRDDAVAGLSAAGYVALPDGDQAGPAALRSALALARPSDGDTVAIDLHWAVDPLTRLLPRPLAPVPDAVWGSVQAERGLPVPAPAHHAALLAHHLAHADLVHVRALLDIALLTGRFPAHGREQYLATAGALGVGPFARGLAGLVARDLGVPLPAPQGADTVRARAGPYATLDVWLSAVARASPRDDEAITPGRIARRLAVLGWRAAPPLLADVVAPPAAFLTWRWPGRGRAAARARHYRQVIAKLMRVP